MRTTLDIDDDVLAAAKELSRLQRLSAGQVVSQLLRQALAGRTALAQPQEAGVGGFRPFAARGVVVSNDKVNELRDAEGV
jgi:Arc/MetJ family transcription regulator